MNYIISFSLLIISFLPLRQSNLRSGVPFWGGARKYGNERVGGSERKKKERLIQLLHESSAAPCLLTQCYLVSSLSCF